MIKLGFRVSFFFLPLPKYGLQLKFFRLQIGSLNFSSPFFPFRIFVSKGDRNSKKAFKLKSVVKLGKYRFGLTLPPVFCHFDVFFFYIC